MSLAAAYCNHTCAAQFGSLGEGIDEMQAKPILDESLAKHGGSSTYTDRLPFNGEIRTTVVSVIVPVWNSATHLQACIDSLLRQTLARDEYEVILVDNGSLDESLRSEEHTSELQSLMRISYAV